MSAIARRLRGIPSWQVTLAVALLALGFLIAAQLAANGPRVRYTTQERSPLMETAQGLQTAQDALKRKILDLRTRIADLEAQGPGSAALVKQLNDQLDAARIGSGLIPLQGPGVVFRLEDSDQPVPPGGNTSDALVSARDIRTLIGELWLAGAEAIAVNGERVTTSTAIIDIGGSVLVNSAYLAPPYQVAALGPKDLYERLSRSSAFVGFVRARVERSGIRLSFAELAAVDLPAFAGTVNVHSAKPDESSAPGG
jgi:uncharacterized protein YlxW (UPF0749 family)